MKNTVLLILLTILISNSVFAQNATALNKGDTAPFKGILLTEERAEKAVKAERSNIVLKDLRIAQDELIDYHKKDAKKQREKLSDAKFDSFMNTLGAFLLGTIMASVAFKLQGKVGDI